MKKTIIIPCLVVLSLLLNIPVCAATPRTIRAAPTITFSGTTATCSVQAEGEYETDKVEITMELYKNGVLIKDWYAYGHGDLMMYKTAAVTHGATYKLVAYVSINGGTPASASTTKYYG